MSTDWDLVSHLRGQVDEKDKEIALLATQVKLLRLEKAILQDEDVRLWYPPYNDINPSLFNRRRRVTVSDSDSDPDSDKNEAPSGKAIFDEVFAHNAEYQNKRNENGKKYEKGWGTNYMRGKLTSLGVKDDPTILTQICWIVHELNGQGVKELKNTKFARMDHDELRTAVVEFIEQNME